MVKNKDEIYPFRVPKQWREDGFPILRETLKTGIPIEKELWIMLRSFSEVKTRGRELFKRYNIANKDITRVTKRFRSYIRQSESYWQAASKTSYKSSSLLYYYSFMNLVKAYLVLENPGLQPDLYHGLKYSTKDPHGTLKKKFIDTGSDNKSIYAQYYKKVFNSSVPNRLNIISLLSYSTEIGYQFLSGKFGPCRIYPFIFRIALDTDRRKSWLIFLLPKEAPLFYYKHTFEIFFDHFEQTTNPRLLNFGFNALFGLKTQDANQYNYFQSKEINEMDLLNESIQSGRHVQKLKELLQGRFEYNYYSDNYSGYIVFPKNRKDIYLMNEEIAIYGVMFFMSEIVRYRPDFLDSMFDSKDNWLLESFVETCPLKFLRMMTCRIIRQTLVFSNF